ncbi:hypothetical protein [Rhodoblastus sp.]|uniref:hypothetical protein n=1 Tax=Rhodoblastus sp. TaxID=1962975 RepID=UPI003F96481A
MESVGLSQLVEIAHSERREIQFWVETGALIPEGHTHGGGRGVHRKFSRDEVIIACILRALANSGTGIHSLKFASTALRDVYLKEKGPRSYIEKSISNKAKVYLVYSGSRDFVLLCDPEKDESYQHIIAPLSGRDDSYRKVVFLNPWLNSVPSV